MQVGKIDKSRAACREALSYPLPRRNHTAEQMPQLLRYSFCCADGQHRDANLMLPGEDEAQSCIGSVKNALAHFFFTQRKLNLQFAITYNQLLGGRQVYGERVICKTADHVIG